MTSKEYMQNELNNLENLLEKEKKEIKKPAFIETTEKHIKLTKQVIKDLEILDILKEYFANDIVSDAARYRMLGKIDFEDEILIGDWLNDR